jgi:glycosyltransferase involved in cell wall biosynthesis
VRVGIDASNIRGGGGVTHLIELLRAAKVDELGVDRVIVWGNSATVSRIEPRPWLDLSHQRELDGRLHSRVSWQTARLTHLARGNVDVLLVLGGLYGGDFSPVVTMSRNLLPFEVQERRRYGWSYMGARLALLERLQARTLRRSNGVIFLTEYHKNAVLKRIGELRAPIAVINHGVSEKFFCAPRPQRPLTAYSDERPYRVVYTSIVDVYKHQWNVVEAVGKLRLKGYPIELRLIGNAYPPALRKLDLAIERVDPQRKFIEYDGGLPNAQLPGCYVAADAFVFASSCETFGQALTEAMASGLPIACSKQSALPEVLGPAGSYFDPLDIEDICRCLAQLMNCTERRTELAGAAYERACALSWEKCARQTFGFLELAIATGQSRDGTARPQRSTVWRSE